MLRSGSPLPKDPSTGPEQGPGKPQSLEKPPNGGGSNETSKKDFLGQLAGLIPPFLPGHRPPLSYNSAEPQGPASEPVSGPQQS